MISQANAMTTVGTLSPIRVYVMYNTRHNYLVICSLRVPLCLGSTSQLHAYKVKRFVLATLGIPVLARTNSAKINEIK